MADIPRDVVDEILLVDDASTDHTAELASRLGLPTIVRLTRMGLAHPALFDANGPRLDAALASGEQVASGAP